MSNGPISRAREAHAAPFRSTNRASATHYSATDRAGGYCGHRGGTHTNAPALVTCTDCQAAMRADGLTTG